MYCIPAKAALCRALNLLVLSMMPLFAYAESQVTTANGIVEGVENSGIRIFKGIPFAQPPVGDLRWKAPQPPKNWTGVYRALAFGPRAMQNPIFGDMNFRSNGMSEDCLYLNVWTPERAEPGSLPVLVYFYGGGYQAGDGSEDRYNGESMARRDIVSVTVNYRLNVFGFMAHPELTRESGFSGNYGLLDQYAALLWVQQNIAAFGGDPSRVTIAGESAGSISVSAQMASPLSKGLFAQAIGESGSLMRALAPVPLTDAERMGRDFCNKLGAQSLEELRALPADQLLAGLIQKGAPWFSMTVDGYFFPEDPAKVYSEKRQAAVPLLLGWNSEEMNFRAIFGNLDPTLENYRKVVQHLYPEHAEEVLRAYHATSDEDVVQVATDLAGDRFIVYSSWKWADAHSGLAPVYRYYFSRARPVTRPELGNITAGLAGGVIRKDSAEPPTPPNKGAVHSAEIEYAMGNLSLNRVYSWGPDDYKVSALMQGYFEQFIKTGTPNGYGLPEWPEMTSGEDGDYLYMQIDVNPEVKPDLLGERYRLLERIGF
ncbi:MAG: carboxylesterase family protein [Opitutales bacterium]|nr:carboxylesterase family protein [Opitutales bacterium]